MIREEGAVKNGAVLVFARRPELGQVKTRLDALIGEESTLALYHAFLSDTLIAAHQCGAKVVLAHTPGATFPEQNLADITFVQHGNSFGERFDFSLRETAKRLPIKTPLILVGADTPQLPPALLRRGLGVLGAHDAVIGPNENGGFYLIGFSTTPIPIAEVFTHPAREEPRELLRLLNRANLKTTFLEPHFDVDAPEDLIKLIRLIDALKRTRAEWIPKNTQTLLCAHSVITTAIQNKKPVANTG